MHRVSFTSVLAKAGPGTKTRETSPMGDKTDKAEDRTKWAEDRTIMANERTFSGWMGSGMGAVGVAIGLKAVFGAFEPTWAAKAVASGFLLIAIVIFWAARQQASKTLNRLAENDSEPMPTHSFTLLASLLTGATLAVGAILWSL
jgi:putative membrane protein